MQMIDVRDLEARASDILRRVREEGTSFEVTDHGRVVARLVAITEPAAGAGSADDFLSSWDRLAQAISERWPDGVTAVDAVRDARRER